MSILKQYRIVVLLGILISGNSFAAAVPEITSIDSRKNILFICYTYLSVPNSHADLGMIVIMEFLNGRKVGSLVPFC